MAELDDNYYRLESQRGQNEWQQQNTQNDIDNIDNKISRLRTAYNTLDQQKESIKDQKKEINRLDDAYKGSWKGEHATSVYDACNGDGTVSSSYQSYIDAIDGIEDAINNEICRLKNLRAEKWGILQGLVRAWNNITTQIRNYFN